MSSWTRNFKNKYSLFSPPIKKEIYADGELLLFTWLFHFKVCLHRRIHIYIYILLSIERYEGQYNTQHCLDTVFYIVDCKQNMTVISSNKKVCVRCSVLHLCSKHRQVRELTTTARAQLACSSARATGVCEW